MTEKLTSILPIRTNSGMNERGSWKSRHFRGAKQRKDVNLLWPWKRREWTFPLVVTLIRIKPVGRDLDDDNLRGSFKYVRDQIAKELGVDDGDIAKIRFEYGQEKGANWAVRVEIKTM